MSLSTCDHCGGFIPLGPKASNRCEDCGKSVFSSPPAAMSDHKALRQRLKSGEYDGTDIMQAWLALDELDAMQAHADELAEALRAAAEHLYEATGRVNEWGAYASDYFQTKWNLQKDIESMEEYTSAARAAIAKHEGRN